MAGNVIAASPVATAGLRPKRACRNCVQIKAKCVPREDPDGQDDSSVCQRCFRLGKECSTSLPAPRKKRKTQDKRVAELEARLNEVSSILVNLQTPPQVLNQASKHQLGSPTQLMQPSNGGNPQSLPTPEGSSAASNGEVTDSLFCQNLFGQGPRNAGPSGDALQKNTTILEELDQSLQQKILGEFRGVMSYFFPFVVLPQQATAATIRKERPNLYRACIFAGCRRYPVWQRELAECILKHTAEAMLVYGERSLDLLQGLLVFVSWYQYHGHINPQLMNLLHLCMSLIVDLGLGNVIGRPPTGSARTIATDAESIIHGRAVTRGVRTNEERRAVLACYFLTSSYSFTFHRLDYIRFTTHLDQCCSDLAAASEYPTDVTLCGIVRLQHLVEQHLIHADSQQQVPLAISVRLFREQFEAFRASLTPAVFNDELFDLHLISGQIVYYESLIPVPSSNTLAKVEALNTGLMLVQKFFSAFMSQYTSHMPTIPYFYWMRVVHALSVLTKLSFLHCDGWDLSYVREAVSFSDTVDRLNEKLWAVQEAEANDCSIGFARRFRAYRAKMEKCKVWFNEMVAQEGRASTATAAGGPEAANLVNFDDPMFHGMFENLDEYLNYDFMGDLWPENAMA